LGFIGSFGGSGFQTIKSRSFFPEEKERRFVFRYREAEIFATLPIAFQYILYLTLGEAAAAGIDDRPGSAALRNRDGVGRIHHLHVEQIDAAQIDIGEIQISFVGHDAPPLC
jgi:hypothetical protein